MSVKRKAGSGDTFSNKRNRVSGNGGADERSGGYEINSRTDPITGQRGAFPGLEDHGDNESLYYGPASDGMEYLRMVRAEAQNVPSMLATASHLRNRPQKRDESHETRHNVTSARFWADEAIVADPSEDPYDDWDENEHVDQEKDPQDAYYGALVARLQALRTRLQQKPPTTSASDSISPQVRNSTSPLANYQQWYYTLTHTEPVPQFVAGLSQQQVIIGLDRLEKVLTKRNLNRPVWRRNLSAWIWSLLARCRDRTELDGDDIGVLRSLAKRAQHLDKRLRAISAGYAQSNDLVEEDDEQTEVEGEQKETVGEAGNEGENEAQQDSAPDLDAARAKLMGLVDSGADKVVSPALSPIGSDHDDSDSLQPTLMLLDSIVTVVGELYGQRDLLEQRAAW